MSQDVSFIWNWVTVKRASFFYYTEWRSIALIVPSSVTTTIAGLLSTTCGLFFLKHFSEQLSLPILPPIPFLRITVIKIMQYSYKHILEAQMPARPIQLVLRASWNFSSKKEKGLESLWSEKNEDWWSRKEEARVVQKTWPESTSGELSLLGYF